MTYTPYDWKTGEKITEERLDYMENGIADASDEVFIVNVVCTQISDGWVVNSADKTAKEIYDAAMDNKVVIARASFSAQGFVATDLFTINDVFQSGSDGSDYGVRFKRLEVEPIHVDGIVYLAEHTIRVSKRNNQEDVWERFDDVYEVVQANNG